MVLARAGAVSGALVPHRRLSEDIARQVAQAGAGWTLLAGGAPFAAARLAGLLDPLLMTTRIATGIRVHNLDQLNLGTALVVGVVLVVLVAMTRAARRLRTGAADTDRHTPPPTVPRLPRRRAHPKPLASRSHR